MTNTDTRFTSSYVPSTTKPSTIRHDLHLTPLPEDASSPAGRARWPLFGVLAGVAGFGSAIAALGNGVTEEDAQRGVGVIDALERGPFHVSFALGLVSIVALFLAAAGWRRWAERTAPDSLAARTIGTAIAATATINVVFVALAGSMAIYLPGGSDAGWLSNEAIFVNFTLLDFGSLLGWWGVAVAALCASALSFGQSRVLPRWMGVASLVLLAPPVLIGLTTGLPGLVGLTMPIWLVALSVGLMLSRTARA